MEVLSNPVPWTGLMWCLNSYLGLKCHFNISVSDRPVREYKELKVTMEMLLFIFYHYSF